MTPDIAGNDGEEASSVIRRVEVPRVLDRARQDHTFVTVLLIAPDLTYGDADRIYGAGVSLENLPALNAIKLPPAGLNEENACEVARRILRERIRVIHETQPPGMPFRISLDTRVPGHLDADVSLAMDWYGRFDGRHCDAQRWDSELIPGLQDVAGAIRVGAPGRTILASGQLGIPAAVALGVAFSSTSGLTLRWLQRRMGKTEEWGIDAPPITEGIKSIVSPQDTDRRDIALLVSAGQDVRPEVAEFMSNRPKMGVVVEVKAEASELNAGTASGVALVVRNKLIEGRVAYQATGTVHLFYAGPVGLAVMIGQQLNTFGRIQLYERDPQRDPTYVPSCVVRTL